MEHEFKRYHVKQNDAQRWAAKAYQEILANPERSPEDKLHAADQLAKLGNTFQAKTLTIRLREAEGRIRRLMARNKELEQKLEELQRVEAKPEIPNSLQDLYR